MSLGAVKIAENAMCECSSEFGYAEVVKGQTSTSAITGMTDDETAVLAGVLAGLATFLFLALPLLCCLCPLPFACCGGGGGKKKAAAAAAAAGAQKRKNIHEFSRFVNSGRSTDVESIGSYRSWDKNWDKLDRFDHDNLYEVDMKLPRVWLETLRGVPDDEVETRLRELTRDGGWEGGNDVNMGKQMSEMEMRREMYEESGSGGMGTDGGRYASVQRMDGSGGGGEELIAEYEISRHITMDTTRMTLPETEYIYERDIRGDSSIADRDNFKRVYYTYQRIKGDDSKQTSF
ncbi:uncharacterized protein [Mytilus edulis]|uniref:uncharacterized protein isoform X1 n=1 Tax=Mytilus edulis TaxID=6550 RepID=UPI0039EFB0FC